MAATNAVTAQKVRSTRVKSGDTVQVIAGRDKGKQGKVLKVHHKRAKVLVEGVNTVKKHVKPSQENPQGGVLSVDSPIHVSNVMIVDPKSGKPTRIGKQPKKDAKTKKVQWVRVAQKSGESLDSVKAARK